MRFPTTPASAIAAVVAAAVLALVGWGLTETVLAWVAPPVEGAMYVIESPLDLVLEHVTASVALALPVVLGWAIAAFYGWRRSEPTGVATLGLTAGLLVGACVCGLTARVAWIHAAWAALGEMVDDLGTSLRPTISIADTGVWRWAVILTILVAVAQAAFVFLRTRRSAARRPA